MIASFSAFSLSDIHRTPFLYACELMSGNSSERTGWRAALTGWMTLHFGHQRPGPAASWSFSLSSRNKTRRSVTQSSVRLWDSVMLLVYVPGSFFFGCPSWQHTSSWHVSVFIGACGGGCHLLAAVSHWLLTVCLRLCNRRWSDHMTGC